MSLIEEALRKQREETERAQLATPAGTPPATPPPLPAGAPAGTPAEPPAADAEVAPERNTRTWRMLVAVGIVIVIVIAVLIWLMVVGIKLFKAPPAAAPVAAARQPSVTATAAPPASLTEPVVAATETAVTTVAASAGPEMGAPPAPAVSGGRAVPPEPPATGTPPAAGGPAATGTPQAGGVTASNEPPSKPLVVWPPIAVTGIMGSGRPGRSAAIVNGQMLSVGDQVESATIVAIEKRGVTFSYSGETRTVSVGASTE